MSASLEVLTCECGKAIVIDDAHQAVSHEMPQCPFFDQLLAETPGLRRTFLETLSPEHRGH